MRRRLGKVRGALRAEPQRWSSAIGSVPELADMIDVLWTDQLDRHGTDDETIPLTVSAEASEGRRFISP